MTKILHANWFSQGHISNLHSTALAVGSNRISSINFRTLLNSSNDEHVNMPTSGHFVGMIVHVGTNTQTVGTTDYRLRARRSTSYSTIVTLATISVPAGVPPIVMAELNESGI